MTHVVDDFVLGEEPGEREHTAQRQGRDHPSRERDRHHLAQATHVLLHVEGVVRRTVADRAGTEEQACLEERVREDVEHRRQPCTSAETEHHVAELRNGRIRKHLLDVVLHERKCSRDDDGDATDHGDEVATRTEDVETSEEHWIETSDEEDTRDDHRRGVQE